MLTNKGYSHSYYPYAGCLAIVIAFCSYWWAFSTGRQADPKSSLGLILAHLPLGTFCFIFSLIFSIITPILVVGIMAYIRRILHGDRPTLFREFFLLRETSIRKEFLLYISKQKERRNFFLLIVFLFVQTGLLAALSLLGSIPRTLTAEMGALTLMHLCSFYLTLTIATALASRESFLPLYHARRREAAERRRGDAEQALTATLPPLRYRVAAGATEVERLRVKMQERVLTDEQAREAAIIVQAHDEMTEAEQALAELEASKAKTATKTLPTT